MDAGGRDDAIRRIGHLGPRNVELGFDDLTIERRFLDHEVGVGERGLQIRVCRCGQTVLSTK